MQAQLTVHADDPALALDTSSSIRRAILLGGAAVGVLDAADGVVWAGVTAGQNPIQVLQWIATGVLGPRAFQGGLAAAGLGAIIHFVLAYAFTAAFVVAFKNVRAVRSHWIAFGLGWGALVWGFMNLLVLPSSPVPQATFTVGTVVNGVLGHALTVGLAAAYVAKRVLGTK